MVHCLHQPLELPPPKRNTRKHVSDGFTVDSLCMMKWGAHGLPKPTKMRPGKYLEEMNPTGKLTNNRYHDRCRDANPANDDSLNRDHAMGSPMQSRKRGHRPGAANLFPSKLHMMLASAEAEGFDHIVSWQSHGRCFKVHQPSRFVDEILPKWFHQTKLASFQRQLSLYGFSRLSTGADRGGYYHEFHLRGHYNLCCRIVRTRVKGTGIKVKPNQETEPNFYTMTPCMEKAPPELQGSRLKHQISPPSPSGIDAPSLSVQKGGIATSASISLNSEEDLPVGECPESYRSYESRVDEALFSMIASSTADGLDRLSPSPLFDVSHVVESSPVPASLCLSPWLPSTPEGCRQDKTGDEVAFVGRRFHYLDPEIFGW